MSAPEPGSPEAEEQALVDSPGYRIRSDAATIGAMAAAGTSGADGARVAFYNVTWLAEVYLRTGRLSDRPRTR